MYLGLSLNAEFPEIVTNKRFKIVEEKLLKNCQIISDSFNLEYSNSNLYKLKDVYKNTVVDSYLTVRFLGKNFESRYYIPVYAKLTNGSVYENGYEAFVVKGLRETVWDLKSESFVKIRLFSYQIDPYINRDLDFYFYRIRLGSLREVLSIILHSNPEYFEESDYLKYYLQKLNLTPKPDLFSHNFNQMLNYEVFRTVMKLAYSNFSYLKEYAINEGELILKSAVLSTIPYELYLRTIRENEETGLSLIHMRVIDETELITSGVTVFILENLTNLIKKSVRRKTEKFVKDVKEIQLSMFIHESRQMEQFFSPVAYLSNCSKLMIYSSPYSFKSYEVDPEFRDVHPNQINNLCAITTGDKSNTGLTLNFTCNAQVDENGRFLNLIEKEKKIFNELFDNYFEKLIQMEVSR